MSFFNKVGSKMGLTDNNNQSAEQNYANEQMEDYDADENVQDNVVNFQTAVNSNAGPQKRQMKVIIIEPTSFDDVQQIADHIKAHKPVVLNFENTDDETAKRIIDFVSGTTYALAGDLKKVGASIFLCAPNNVNVSFSDLNKSNIATGDKLPWE